jgi:hypothetical protein
MPYKIELRYIYGWDDAEWTEETDGVEVPLRFRTRDEAMTALEEFFAGIRTAVAAGNMDTEEDLNDYRIVRTGS